MPKYEKIRNRVDRKKDVASKRSKLQTCIAVANSAFFLWLLSALALAIGGSYFTTQQRCVDEADRMADQSLLLHAEVQTRQLVAVFALFQSKTYDEFVSKVSARNSFVSEYSALTASDLTTKFVPFMRRSNFPDTLNRKQTLTPPILNLLVEVQAHLMMPSQPLPSDILEKKRQKIKDELKVRNEVLVYVPACSFKRIVKQMVLGDRRILDLNLDTTSPLVIDYVSVIDTIEAENKKRLP